MITPLVIKIDRGSTVLLHFIECFMVQLESVNRRYKHRINYCVLGRVERKIRRIQ